jgi:hypothetical protein
VVVGVSPCGLAVEVAVAVIVAEALGVWVGVELRTAVVAILGVGLGVTVGSGVTTLRLVPKGELFPRVSVAIPHTV